MNVAVYARISTDRQKENTSLEVQISNGIKFCTERAYNYTVFSEVESGADENRPAFVQMLKKITNGEFDAIWLWDYDRIIRGTKVMIYFEDIILKSKCKIFVRDVEKNISEESDSFEYTIRSLLSDIERKKIKSRMASGKKSRLEKGEITLGIAGIGYNKLNGKLIKNELEAELIRETFTIFMYSSVKSYRDCIKKLKIYFGEDLDKRINEKSLSRILSDEKYTGNFRLTFEKREYNIKIDKIVDEELFLKVNQKIKALKKNRKSYSKIKYLLNDGKVICGCCGEKMWIRGTTGDYRYYFCKTKFKQRRYNFDSRFSIENKAICNNINDNKINSFQLENIVWNSLFEVIDKSEDIKTEYKKLFDKKNSSMDANLISLKYVKLQLKEKEQIYDGLVAKFALDKITDEEMERNRSNYIRDIQGLKIDKERIEAEYEKIKNSDHVYSYLDNMIQDLKSKKESERHDVRKKFIDKYIDWVSVKINNTNINNSKRNEYTIRIKLKLGGFESVIFPIKEVQTSEINVYILDDRDVEIW